MGAVSCVFLKIAFLGPTKLHSAIFFAYFLLSFLKLNHDIDRFPGFPTHRYAKLIA